MSTFPPFYELRLYRCEPGRIPDLHQRMGYDVKPLFARHGVRQPLAYWSGIDGPMAPLYAYLLRWDDLDERMAAFGAFYQDPEWHEQRERSNAGRQMVERIDVYFMSASAAWNQNREAVIGEIGGIHELRIQHVLNGKTDAAAKSLSECEFPFIERHGGTVLGAFDLRIGPQCPKAIQILAWKDEAARLLAWRAYDEDSDIAQMRREERRKYGRPLFGATTVCAIHPAPYGIAKANFGDLE